MEDSSLLPTLPLPAAALEQEVAQGPKTVMGALKQQTELIKSLQNSLYISMRPLTNGRFVLPALPVPLTGADDEDATIDPEAALEIIRQQTEAISSLQKSVSKMRPMISNLVSSKTKSPPQRRGRGRPKRPAANHTTVTYRTAVQQGEKSDNDISVKQQHSMVQPTNFAEACSSFLTRARESTKGGVRNVFVDPLTPKEDGIQTTDAEIDAIIEARREKGQWPLKRNTYKQFTNDEDLVKVRFHRSEKYPHLP